MVVERPSHVELEVPTLEALERSGGDRIGMRERAHPGPAGFVQIRHEDRPAVSVATHYIHFTQVTPEEPRRRQAARKAIGEYSVAHHGEIECRLDALTTAASKTTIITTRENGVPRITRIEINGEHVAHLF